MCFGFALPWYALVVQFLYGWTFHLSCHEHLYNNKCCYHYHRGGSRILTKVGLFQQLISWLYIWSFISRIAEFTIYTLSIYLAWGYRSEDAQIFTRYTGEEVPLEEWCHAEVWYQCHAEVWYQCHAEVHKCCDSPGELLSLKHVIVAVFDQINIA